jgi:hypothetical protein
MTPRNLNPLKGFVAAVLTKDAQRYLKVFSKYSQVIARHCVLAYDIAEDRIPEQYQIGKEVELDGYEIVSDKLCQALRVRGIESDRPNLHITISCKGVKPNYSNDLLAKGGEAEGVILKLKAIITFCPFPHQPQ